MRSSASSTIAAARPGPSPPIRIAAAAAQVDVEQASARRAARSRRCGSRDGAPRSTAARGSLEPRRSAGAARCPSIRAAPSSRTDRRTRRPRSRSWRRPASAARTMAPRLPGSCTSWAMSTSGAAPAYRRRASAARPTVRARRSALDDLTGLTTAMTWAVVTTTSTPARSSAGHQPCDLGPFERRGQDGRALERQARGQRVGDEVRAVEQEPVGSLAPRPRLDTRAMSGFCGC